MIKHKEVIEIFRYYDESKIIFQQEINPRVKLIVTDKGDKYVIKLKEKNYDFQKEYIVLSTLETNKVPVAKLIITRDGKYFIENDEKRCFGLYSYIEGNGIGILQLNNRNLINYGTGIAILHRGLKKCEEVLDYFELNFIDQIFKWQVPAIKRHLRRADESCINAILTEVENFKDRYDKLPVQLIHRDLHSENIIFRDGKICGFLDFENCIVSARMFDICGCASDMLRRIFEISSKRKKIVFSFSSLLEGYNSITPLSKEEWDSFWYIMLIEQLYYMGYYYEIERLDVADFFLRVCKWTYIKKWYFVFELENSSKI